MSEDSPCRAREADGYAQEVQGEEDCIYKLAVVDLLIDCLMKVDRQISEECKADGVRVDVDHKALVEVRCSICHSDLLVSLCHSSMLFNDSSHEPEVGLISSVRSKRAEGQWTAPVAV